jgi:hypothetical protein
MEDVGMTKPVVRDGRNAAISKENKPTARILSV